MKKKVKLYLGDLYHRATKTEKRKHVPTDLNRTLTQSGPDDELTEEEFKKKKREGYRTWSG